MSCEASIDAARFPEVPAFCAGTPHPIYETEGISAVYGFHGATGGDFGAYCAALATAGFALYARNAIGNSAFVTFIKGDVQVRVACYPSQVQEAYYPPLSMVKIICTRGEAPPPVAVEPFIKTVTPSITQIGRKGAEHRAPGMSYIVQNADGSYIIIDGGGYEEWDVDHLYDFLVSHKTGTEKPVIAAWMITHAHSDHMNCAIAFLSKYHERIELRAVAYNFPDFNKITMEKEDPCKGLACVSQWNDALTLYPDTRTRILHAGDRWFFPGVEIETIFTHEDFYPKATPWINHTSCAWRVKTAGRTVLMLGDCEKTLCQQMTRAYGKALKCDVLQMTHHGSNGACLELYQCADPNICFWAIDKDRFQNDLRVLGVQAGFEFNAWIRDASIRQREHYHSSTTTTIVLD